MLASEKRLVGWHMVVAILALFVGSLFGPMQGLEHAGVDLYTPLMDAGLLQSYYQGLSLHGVLNALVWTTVFITGFLTLVIVNSLKTPIRWEDGYVIPPTAPGLGVELDEAAADAHPYLGDDLHLDMVDRPLH